MYMSTIRSMIQEQAPPHRYDLPTLYVDSIKSQRYNIYVLLRLTIYIEFRQN